MSAAAVANKSVLYLGWQQMRPNLDEIDRTTLSLLQGGDRATLEKKSGLGSLQQEAAIILNISLMRLMRPFLLAGPTK